MNRGVVRRVIYRQAADYERFTEGLKCCANLYQVQIHAYVLMENHYHLLVTTPLANLSAFMLSLQTRYGVYFNKRHRQSGHVFQGRFKPQLVEENDYLLWLSRYIHLNPVHTRAYKDATLEERLAALKAYPWSSYPDYTRQGKRRNWLSYGLLEKPVQGKTQNARAYRRYIEAGLAENQDEWEKMVTSARLGIGSADFLDRLGLRYEALTNETEVKAEDVSLMLRPKFLSPKQIVSFVCREMGVSEEQVFKRRGGGLYRGLVAKMLQRYAGLTQREVAKFLGLRTGAAVSMGIKALTHAMEKDSALAGKMEKLERSLDRQGRR